MAIDFREMYKLVMFNIKNRRQVNEPFFESMNKMIEKKLCDNCHCSIKEGDEHNKVAGNYLTCKITLYVGEKAKRVTIARPVDSNYTVVKKEMN